MVAIRTYYRALDAVDPEREYGARFDGSTDDTVALQAAIDAADAGGGGVVLVKRTCKITDTIGWPRRVRLMGAGFGDIDGSAFYPTIKWAGAAGGTMLEIDTNSGVTSPAASATYVKFDGNTSNQAGKLINSVDRLDWDFSFIKCAFIRCNGNAIDLNTGATNLYFYDFRADNIAGYFVNTVRGGSYAFDKFTLDTGTGGTAKGLIFYDPSSSSQQANIGVSNGRIELNSALAGNKVIVQLDLSNVGDPIVQAWVSFANVNITTVGSATSSVLVKNIGGTTYEQWCAVGVNTQFTGAAFDSGLLAVGATASGPPAGKTYPLWVFAPFTSGGATNSPPYLQRTWISGGGLMLPDIPTSDPAVAGQVWANSGVLTVSAG